MISISLSNSFDPLPTHSLPPDAAKSRYDSFPTWHNVVHRDLKSQVARNSLLVCSNHHTYTDQSSSEKFLINRLIDCIRRPLIYNLPYIRRSSSRIPSFHKFTSPIIGQVIHQPAKIELQVYSVLQPHSVKPRQNLRRFDVGVAAGGSW